MAKMTLHFRRDFANDEAVVKVNGRPRFRDAGLTTKLLLDVAETVELRVPEGMVKVSVSLPGRQKSAESEFRVTGELHVEVWYLDGKLELRAAPERPAYL